MQATVKSSIQLGEASSSDGAGNGFNRRQNSGHQLRQVTSSFWVFFLFGKQKARQRQTVHVNSAA